MWASLFPGQGSQFPGMGRFLYENFRSAQLLFEEASDHLGLDCKTLCFEGPEAELAKTENTQPALLLVSVATHRAVVEVAGPLFSVSAGHSVGEYASLVTAQALPFSAALKAVRQRGQFMQSAVPLGHGGMVAVLGLENHQVRELCTWAQKESALGVLEPANFNAPGQVVISGATAALGWLQKNFSPEVSSTVLSPPVGRVRFIELKVSAPFHCSMMKPAQDKMAEVLNRQEFCDSQIPVVQNLTAQPVSESLALRQNLIQQVAAPVRWTESVEQLSAMGVQRALELGPGKVLAGLIKKIVGESLEVISVGSMQELKALEKV